MSNPKKTRMGDMSYKDRNEYRYYRRLLGDLHIYGRFFLEDLAKDRVERLEAKYRNEDKNELNKEPPNIG